jgi:hypothetical protein
MHPHESALADGAHRKDDERPASRWWVIAIVIVGILLVGSGVWLTQAGGVVEDQRDAAVQQKDDLADRVISACAAGGESSQELQRIGACQQAVEARADPAPDTVPAQGERGPGPTLEEIQAAVESYMIAHPPPPGEQGRPPTPAEVAAAVAEHMAANPPEPGRPPTAAEIGDAVTLYFAANPPEPGPRGDRGATGERGPGPTPEEIRAAVVAELAQNPPPQGEPGEQGEPGPTCPPGSTLEPVLFASGESGLGCVTGDGPNPTTVPTTTDPPTETTMSDEGDGGLLGG